MYPSNGLETVGVEFVSFDVWDEVFEDFAELSDAWGELFDAVSDDNCVWVPDLSISDALNPISIVMGEYEKLCVIEGIEIEGIIGVYVLKQNGE